MIFTEYHWAGGYEAMLRFGPEDGPVVIAALPLFEEANRTRAFTLAILRALTTRGIASALPDLPGQGESLTRTEDATFDAIQAAYRAAIEACATEGARVYGLGIRSGALIDAGAPLYGRWHLSPQSGVELIRELGRLSGLSASPDWWCTTDQVEIAGNMIGVGLLEPLQSARLFDDRHGVPLRVARMESDAKPADIKLPGAPLWRRAEPDNDISLAALIADDIAAWVRQCEG